MSTPALRTIADLEREAALREPHAATRDLDERLVGEGAARQARAPHSLTQRTWLESRRKFFDDAIRKNIVAEEAQVIVIGCGLDPILHRMPAGLIRREVVHLIDRGDVLGARRARLAQVDVHKPDLLEQAADPLDMGSLPVAITELPLRPHARLGVILIGAAPYADEARLYDLLGALGGLPCAQVVVTFDWFGADTAKLPDAIQAELGAFGSPFGLQPLGLDMTMRTLPAPRVDTKALMRFGELEIGLGTTIYLRG